MKIDVLGSKRADDLIDPNTSIHHELESVIIIIIISIIIVSVIIVVIAVQC